MGSYDKAIYYFKRYIKNSVAELWNYALYNLALCYFKKNDYKNAEKKLKQYLSKYSDIEDQLTNSVRYLLTEILLDLNQKYFNQKGKNNSNLIKRAEKLLTQTEKFEFKHPELWFKLAFIKDCMNNIEESKILYEKIIEKHPNSLDAILNLSRLYFNEGELEKAEKLLEKAFLIDKKNSKTWNAITSLKEKQGKKEEYYEACKKSLEYSSNNEEKKVALNNLGGYYLSIENYEMASKYFQKSLELDKLFEIAISGLVRCLWKLKEYDEIIKFTEVLDYTPNNAVNLKFRAYAFSEIGEFDNALEIVDKLIPIIKNDNMLFTDFYDTKGDLYRKRGDLEKAIELYKEALDKSETEYSFLSETKRKINECSSSLDK